MSDFALTEAVINFAAGTEVNWNAFQLPIPANMVVYTIDTKKFKRGDGVRKYVDLPPGPSIAGIIAGDQSVATVLEQLAPSDDDALIVVDGDKYVASETKLTTLINRLTAVTSSDATQSANITTISSQFGMVNTGVTVGDNNKLVVVGNKKLSVGPTQESLVYQKENPVITIRDINFYSDITCTKKLSALEADSICYAEVSCFHESIDVDSLSITLVENSSYITVLSLGHGLFRLITTKPIFSGQVAFTATVAYNADSVTISKNIVLNAYHNIVITAFGSAGNEANYNTAFGGAGNLYCVGYTQEGGASSYTSFIYKFDQNMNIMFKKRFGSATAGEAVRGISLEAGGNPYIAGQSSTESANGAAFIAKLSGDFNTVLFRKFFNGTGNEQFESLVTDSNGNVFGVGYSLSDGDAVNGSAFIVKFNSNLDLLSIKKINGSGVDRLQSITRDASNNIYCVGWTNSEGAGGYEALIMKFDSDLNQLACKRIGGTGNERFYRVIVHAGNIFTVGWSDALGSYTESFICKFDTNLNVLVKKEYSFSNHLVFESITNITSGGVAVSGYVTIGGKDYGIVATFDLNLNIINAKKIGSSLGNFYLNKSIRTNPVTGDIVASGETNLINGTNDCIFVKFSQELPSGSYASTLFPSIEIADIALTSGTLALTDAACSLSAAASALALSNSTLLGVANSSLAITIDNIKI